MGFKTPLYETHVAAGARMVDFGGWDMPVHYGSQIEEHHAVRRDAITARIGEETRTLLGAVGLHAFAREYVAHDTLQLVVGDSHGSGVWRDDARCAMRRAEPQDASVAAVSRGARGGTRRRRALLGHGVANGSMPTSKSFPLELLMENDGA